MASIDYTNWIELEPNSEVLTQIEQENPFLGTVRTVSMSSRTKVTDRSIKRNPQFLTGNTSRPVDYPQETGAGDKILLSKEKIGDRVPLDEDEVRDMQADVLRAEFTEVGIGGQHIAIRAMTMGDSGSRSDLSIDVPYDSIWQVMRYGRNPHFGSVTEGPLRTNLSYLSLSETPVYDDFVDLKATVDTSKYARMGRARWYADVAWRAILEKVKDAEGNPMLATAQEGLTPRLLGAPINFCHGMEVAPTKYLPLPFLSGTGVPDNSLGVDDDFYIDTDDPNTQTSNTTKSLKLYRKEQGNWTGQILNSTGTVGNRIYTGATDFSVAEGLENGGFVIVTSASNVRGTMQNNTLLAIKLNVPLDGVNAGQTSTTGQFGLLYADPQLLIMGGRENPAFRLTGSDASDPQDDLWLKYRERYAFAVGRQQACAFMVKRLVNIDR